SYRSGRQLQELLFPSGQLPFLYKALPSFLSDPEGRHILSPEPFFLFEFLSFCRSHQKARHGYRFRLCQWKFYSNKSLQRKKALAKSANALKTSYTLII